MKNAYFKFHQVASTICSSFWYTMAMVIVVVSLLVAYPVLMVLAACALAAHAVRMAYKTGNFNHLLGAVGRVFEAVLITRSYQQSR